VIVQQAGQVNVGGQQINVVAERERNRDADDRQSELGDSPEILAP
jgi:hypothetical protein